MNPRRARSIAVRSVTARSVTATLTIAAGVALTGASASAAGPIRGVTAGAVPAVSTGAVRAEPSGPCASGADVTVVVDFGALGGGVRVGCARGPQTNALEALANAGFEWEGTRRYPTFVCRIDAKPTDARCLDASPPNATWVYWTATPGGTWNYSNVGAAGSATAAPGTVQGWSWSTGQNPPPAIAPPVVPTTTAPAAPPTTAPPAPPRPVGGSGSSGASGNGAGASGRPTGSSSAPGTVGATAAPQPDPAVPWVDTGRGGDVPGVLAETTVPGPVDAEPVVPVEPGVPDELPGDEPSPRRPPTDGTASASDVPDDAPEVAAAGATTVTVRDDGGSPVGTLVAASAVAVLGATAAVVARRRRSGAA